MKTNTMTTQIEVMKLVTTLAEKGGIYGNQHYVGVARDSEDNNWIVCRNKKPESFVVKDGELVITSGKLKGAVAFTVNDSKTVKVCFTEYCAAHGLVNPICFQVNSLEKAMVIATLTNATEMMASGKLTAENVNSPEGVALIKQLQQVGIVALEETQHQPEDLQEFVADNGGTLSNAEAQMFTGFKDTLIRVEEPELTQEESLSKTDALIECMRKNSNSSPEELELIERLQRMVDNDREYAKRLDQRTNRPEGLMQSLSSALLKNTYTPRAILDNI